MIDLLVKQKDCNRAFRRWADALTDQCAFKDYGWVIEGKGVVFTNYGHGDSREITTQVMLGMDPEYGDGVVKIVRPKAVRGAKGPVTVIGKDEKGRLKLLREGRLQKNNLSRLIVGDFGQLSGLTDVPVRVSGERSNRHWYVVADLDAEQKDIVARTADFAIACARARTAAGGGKPRVPVDEFYGYGMDEKGRVTTVTHIGGTKEVTALQGYVDEELKKIIGNDLRKPKRNGYCVDGMVESANLLIEIKTSTDAHSLHEAVGSFIYIQRLLA